MQTLGKYQLDTLLGQGGMGAVYRSFHPLLNRPVAIKVMLGPIAADPQARQRFMREAQVVAVLSHPNIVNIFDVDVQDGQPYIVMDFVEGGSLSGRLRAGPLAPDAAMRMLIPLAEALEYAHGQGVIHRDLKPANVLLRPDGNPVLADFGLARPIQVQSADQITSTGALLGTLAYMAPEQFSGGVVDARTDIYALGVMIFEMLVGRPPFEGDTAQVLYGHLHQAPTPPRSINPALPDRLERLVLRMLAKDPAARPQSAAEVAAALRSLLAGPAATGPTVALTQPPTVAVPAAGGPTASFPPAPSGSSVDGGSTGPDIPSRAGIPGVRPVPNLRPGLLAIVALAAIIVLPGIVIPKLFPPDQNPAPMLTTFPLLRPTPGPAATTVAGASELELERVAITVLTEVQSPGPESFSVGNLTYKDVNGSLWFFGEVRNDGEESRESVAVRVNLLDETGKEVASQIGYISMSYLEPGEISSFSVLFSKDSAPPPFSSYALEVRGSAANFKPGYSFRELQIDGEPRVQRDGYGFINVDGRVRNAGETDARFARVFVVFYDAAGKVVGISDAFAEVGADNLLAAGASARFEIRGVIFTGEPARYRLFAEGSQAQ